MYDTTSVLRWKMIKTNNNKFKIYFNHFQYIYIYMYLDNVKINSQNWSVGYNYQNITANIKGSE